MGFRARYFHRCVIRFVAGSGEYNMFGEIVAPRTRFPVAERGSVKRFRNANMASNYVEQEENCNFGFEGWTDTGDLPGWRAVSLRLEISSVAFFSLCFSK